MSDVFVEQKHNVSIEEAKAKIADFESMMSKYGVKAEWKGASAALKGTGVSGGIDVTPTAVKVTVKLGLMAKAIGVDSVKLKGSIEKRLKAAFEGPA
jgi:putative polyhydroxyalkanoate system protein